MNLSKPFHQSYWVRPGLLCAGQYPGSEIHAEAEAKLNGLLDCSIRRTINLVQLDERAPNGKRFVPYQDILQSLAAQRGQVVECLRMDFPDGSVPGRKLMSAILDSIDASIEASEPVYVHCFGGHGRTGTVIGCYLVRHGDTAEQALARIKEWRKPLPHNWHPFENGQEEFVRGWQPGW